MQTIYVDVLLTLNIYVNFFLLRTAARLTHSHMKNRRCILSAAYGSLYSLMIVLPELPFLLSTAVKLFAAVSMVLIAMGYRSRRRLIVSTAAFLASNFILAGAVYAVCTWLRPGFMHFRNGCFYIDFSLIMLIAVTALMYLAVSVFRAFSDTVPDGSYEVTVRRGTQCTRLRGLADTGNSLIDCFTGVPVIICGRSDFPDAARTRPVPCSTVSGGGMIDVFTPDEVVIRNCDSGEIKAVTAVIGLGSRNGLAVFTPKLLR